MEMNRKVWLNSVQRNKQNSNKTKQKTKSRQNQTKKKTPILYKNKKTTFCITAFLGQVGSGHSEKYNMIKEGI